MNKPVVLITGALTGIGRATAVAFAHEGARLVVSGRREEEGQALAKELRGLGAEAEFVKADVRKDEDVRKLVDKTISRFGRLDVAVNNAGTEGQPGPLTEQTAETYATTALALQQFSCTSAVVFSGTAGGGGASGLGDVTVPAAWTSNYGASFTPVSSVALTVAR